jgi:predicted PurR-regulated permease PerM
MSVRELRVSEIAVIVIAAVLVLGAAKLAADFLVPIVAGVLLAYALTPLVERVEQARVPRAIAAMVVLFTIVGLAGATAWWLRHDAAAVVAELPQAARKLRDAVRSDGRPGPLAHVQEAAAELEKAAAEAQGKAPAPKPDPTPAVGTQLTTHMADVIELAGQLGIAATLALFLLAAGDTFRRKLLHIVGGPLSKRRVTVEILNEINVQVQRYLLVMLITNIVIALLCWGAFSLVGLARPALWATVTGILHFIPYVGGVFAAGVVAAASLVETGSMETTVYAVLATLAIVFAIGMGFNTWLQGRACRMNAVSVFVAVLLFGWLWGGWGLLLGAPLAAVAKTIADRVEGLNKLGELMGETAKRAEPDANPESASSTSS